MTDPIPFAWALAWILEREGGYVNDPNDHGGATNFGITQRTYDAWRKKHNQDSQDVRLIGQDEVAAIYREEFWNRVWGDQIAVVSPKMALCVFDAAVQSPPGVAERTFQRVVRTEADGKMGKVTLACYRLRRMSLGDELLLEAYLDRRRGFYAAIVARDPSQAKFSKGWRNRRNALRQTVGLEPEDETG